MVADNRLVLLSFNFFELFEVFGLRAYDGSIQDLFTENYSNYIITFVVASFLKETWFRIYLLMFFI